MKKTFSFFFLLLALVISFQLIGIEQAFCEDSAFETNCQDCVTCVLSPFAPAQNLTSAPDLSRILFTLLSDSASKIEAPSFIFFRPPICR